MQLLQGVAKLVQMVVTEKWHACKRAAFTTKGDGMFRFRRTWEAPGFVTIPKEGPPKLIFFLKEIPRRRWAGEKLDVHAKRGRTQQHGPPRDLPEGTVPIYTDGSAEPRQLGKPPQPAGYGVAAVVGGEGH